MAVQMALLVILDKDLRCIFLGEIAIRTQNADVSIYITYRI